MSYFFKFFTVLFLLLSATKVISNSNQLSNNHLKQNKVDSSIASSHRFLESYTLVASLTAKRYLSPKKESLFWSKKQLSTMTVGVDLSHKPLVIVDDKLKTVSGAGIDYLTLYGNALDIQFIPRIYKDTHDLNRALLAKEIDLAIGIGQQFISFNTEENANQKQAKLFEFADTPATLITKSATKLPKNLEGKKIIYLPKQIDFKNLRSHFPDAILIEASSDKQPLFAVANGSVDAFVGDSRIFFSSEGISDEVNEILGIVNGKQIQDLPVGLYFAFHPKENNLIKRFTQVRNFLPHQAKQALDQRWFDLSEKYLNYSQIALTTKEKDWINSHPVISVAVPKMAAPIAFIAKDNRYAGLSASILELISKRTGLIFNPSFSISAGTALQETYSGRAMMTAFAVDSGSNNQLLFTMPIVNTSMSIVSLRGDKPRQHLNEIIDSKIALIEGDPLRKKLIDKGVPASQIMTTKNALDALASVASGDVKAAILYCPIASYFVSQYYASILQISGTINKNQTYIRFAVNSEFPELQSILDKAIATIPRETLDTISTHWGYFVPVINNWQPNRVLLQNIGLAGIVLLIFILSWNARLYFNIRNKKRASLQLEQRILFMHRVIDANPNPSYICNTQGLIIDCNQAMCNALQNEKSAMLGHSIESIPIDDLNSRQLLARLYKTVCDSKKRILQELSLIVNGEKIDGIHWVVPLHTTDERTIHFEGIIGGWVDVTAQKILESDLRHAKEAAEKADRAKTIFLATISHEVRTPMNVVIGALELIEHTNDAEIVRQATLARDAATNLLAVLNDILEYSRIEAGEMPLTLAANNLKETLKNVVGLYQHSANEKGLSLNLSISDNLSINYYYDQARLRQILNNLLSNAIKFTDYGQIDVIVNEVYIDNSQSNIIIQIKDTGIGISSENLPFVFEPFKQSHIVNHRHFGGSGMGLAICQRIITAMKGSIKLQSKLNKGTCVKLVFNFSRDVSEPIKRLPIERSSQLNFKKGAVVLAVDDHPANLVLLETQLRRLGFQVHLASAGNEALNIIENNLVDVVLTDCNMPHMDGYQLTMAIREKGYQIPIIGYSADASDKCLQRCIDAGMYDRLIKPVSLQNLAVSLIGKKTSSKTKDDRLAHPDKSDFNDNISSQSDFDQIMKVAHGDTAIAIRLVSLFIESIDEARATFTLATQNADIATLHHLTHRNKGPAAMLKFDSLVNACNQFNSSCENLKDKALNDAVNNLRSAFEDCRNRLIIIKNKLSNNETIAT